MSASSLQLMPQVWAREKQWKTLIFSVMQVWEAVMETLALVPVC